MKSLQCCVIRPCPIAIYHETLCKEFVVTMIGGMDAITFCKVYESKPWVAKQMPG